jgi:hypothetical protein
MQIINPKALFKAPKHFLLFFPLFILITTVSADIWPNDISSELIQEYIMQNKKLLPDESSHKYDYILNFLEDAIAATQENIINFHDKWGPIKKSPGIIEDQLIIISKKSSIRIWDEQLNTFIEKLDIFVGSELINLIKYMETYNQLVEHWFNLHRQKLRTLYNITNELSAISGYLQ